MDSEFIQAVRADAQRRVAAGETPPQEMKIIEPFSERRRAKTKDYVTASIISMVAEAGMTVDFATRQAIVPYKVGSLKGQFDCAPEYARQPLLAGNQGKLSRKKRKTLKASN